MGDYQATSNQQTNSNIPLKNRFVIARWIKK
jgi:hypothetical protein